MQRVRSLVCVSLWLSLPACGADSPPAFNLGQHTNDDAGSSEGPAQTSLGGDAGMPPSSTVSGDGDMTSDGGPVPTHPDDPLPGDDPPPSDDPPPATSDCTHFDPNVVYAFGVTDAFFFYGDARVWSLIVTPLDGSGSPCTTLTYSGGDAYIRKADGRLVYPDSDGHLEVFTPDPLVWTESDARYELPDDPHGNDLPLSSPCDGHVAAGLSGARDSSDFIVDCEGSYSWNDGQSIAENIAYVAGIGADHLVLGYTASDGYAVVDNQKQVHALSMQPARVDCTRASDAGVLFVDTSSAELWEADEAGNVTVHGALTPLPDGVTGTTTCAIDAAGVVYQVGTASKDSAQVAVVMTRALANQGDTTILLDQRETPASDLSTDPPSLELHGTDIWLLTGP